MIPSAPNAAPVTNVTTATTGGEFTGYAQCVNPDCDAAKAASAHGKLRPIALRRTIMETRAPDMPMLVLGATTHIEIVNDADIYCGECGQPSSLLETAPPKYRSMGYAA